MRWICWIGAWLTVSCAAPVTTVPVFVPAAAEPVARAKVVALVPRLDAFLQEWFDDSGATGMVAGVVLDGELVYERSFGLLARGSAAAVSGDSVFRVASLSKSFTALAVLQLRDAGKLALDVPVTDYLPELSAIRRSTRDAAPITARMLLTHSAGLAWDDLWGAVSFGFNEAELAAFLQAGVPLAREPGSGFEYSNLGFALLGRLIERVSGSSFEDYMTQHILRPLGMSSTAWNARAVPASRMAVGYWGDKEPLAEAPRVGDGVFEPAGGMYTTLHDYARYLGFQLSAYPARDEPERGPVRRSSVREAHQPQRSASHIEEPIAEITGAGLELHHSSYGFGWFVESSCDYRERLQHAGWEPGYHAGAIMFPAQRIAVVTMATSQPARAAEGMLKLLRDADALPAPLEAAASSELVAAQQRVQRLLESWDDQLAEQTFDTRAQHYPWRARLKDDFSRLKGEHGRCELQNDLRAISRLEGTWKLRCERGAIDLRVQLTPEAAPRVLFLRWTEQLPPDERMSRSAAQLVAAIGAAQPAASLGRDQLNKQFAHAAIDHGTCSIDSATSGDGHTFATFALKCQHAPLELELQLDESGQVVEADLHKPRVPGATCWQ